MLNYRMLMYIDIKLGGSIRFFVAEWYFQRHILAKALELTRDEWLKKKI